MHQDHYLGWLSNLGLSRWVMDHYQSIIQSFYSTNKWGKGDTLMPSDTMFGVFPRFIKDIGALVVS